MAEEIALDTALEEVDRFMEDEPDLVFKFTLGLPEHPADENLLEDGFEELFQDRVFEGYLSGPPLEAGGIEGVWDEFANTRKRDPSRGYRRPFEPGPVPRA